MGVAGDLGFVYQPPNAFRRSMQAIAGTRFGAWFFSKTIESMDRVCRKVTNDRRTATQLLAGLPVIYVTTTGRKSGDARTHPLVAVPVHDTLAIIGSNFGGKRTPGWVFNLEADATARVRYADAERDVRARAATDDERAAVWNEARVVYPGYDKYQERVTGREIRIFLFEPT
jgi:deazaflavin-dependent oxidoreductase (nitroreductase family)